MPKRDLRGGVRLQTQQDPERPNPTFIPVANQFAGWLVELFGDRHSAAGLTAALPELRLLVAEAVARAQPATSDAKDSKTST